MTQVRITAEIGIDMGHRIAQHGSKCANLHGHRYRIEVTCEGTVIDDDGLDQPENGMVLDFGFLKQVMLEQIDLHFDHGTCLWYKDPILIHDIGLDHQYIVDTVVNRGWCNDRIWKWGKLVILRETPTAENLAKHWADRIALPIHQRSNGNAMLYSVRVWETPNFSTVYRYDHSKNYFGKPVPSPTEDDGDDLPF